MTYCVALSLEEGMVFISDTRTNAGVDQISIFPKLFSFGIKHERVIMLQTAGNLATTQAVIAKLRQRIDNQIEPNIYSVNTMFEVAELVGGCVEEVIHLATRGHTEQTSIHSCSILLGGQIKGQDMELYNIYREGNFIRSSKETPYFQIGESKYGKPIMDRTLTYTTPLSQALRCSLISFASTIRSNVSVGMPLDVMVYTRDSLIIPNGKRVFESDAYYQSISEQWSEILIRGLMSIPEPTGDYFV